MAGTCGAADAACITDAGKRQSLALSPEAAITMLGSSTSGSFTAATAPSWVFGLVYSGSVSTAADRFTASPYRKPAALSMFATEKIAQITVRGGVVTKLVIAEPGRS